MMVTSGLGFGGKVLSPPPQLRIHWLLTSDASLLDWRYLKEAKLSRLGKGKL